MHIEIMEGKGEQPWHWHILSGKITANGEGHGSKRDAVRAACGVIIGARKPHTTTFTEPKWNAKRNCWVIKWS